MTAVVDTVVHQPDSLSGLRHLFPHLPGVFLTVGSQVSLSGNCPGKLLYLSKLSSHSVVGVATKVWLPFLNRKT